MKMDQIIHERRCALGLTQEQVADALGITAPAVNKWEKGTTCPDLALLAPLARLLGIDMNALFSFYDDLSDQEIQRFAAEVIQATDREGLAAGFALAREKLHTYPNSDLLIYQLAAVLQGLLRLSTDAREREDYESQLAQWYEHILQSENAQLRTSASLLLAAHYIKQKDWEAAQRAIDLLPERTLLDRRMMLAKFYLAQGQPEEAARLLEQVLLISGQELSMVLLFLENAERTIGNLDAAEHIAKVLEAVSAHLDLCAYFPRAAFLEVALARKDARRSVELLRQIFESVVHPWLPHESPLYRRAAKVQVAAPNARILPALIEDLAHIPDYDFLRDDPDFQALLKKYRN